MSVEQENQDHLVSFHHPSLDGTELVSLFQNKRFDLITDIFLQCLDYYYFGASEETLPDMQKFCSLFTQFYLHPDFKVKGERISKLIKHCNTIGSVFALSQNKTTDDIIAYVSQRATPAYKILSFYSIHNKYKIDLRKIQQLFPELYTDWFFALMQGIEKGFLQSDNAHLEALMLQDYDKFTHINAHLTHLYFLLSYQDNRFEASVKRALNQLVQRCGPFKTAITAPKTSPSPNRTAKIAVITANWFPGHSIHRSQYDFLAHLGQFYDLTLVHLGRMNPQIDESLFEDVMYYEALKGNFDLEPLLAAQFDVVYHPDAGMNFDSILLINARLAPLQITNYGHPASTFGSHIDYWIVGEDVEILDQAEQNYSERLCAIPGCAAIPVVPDYQCQYPELTQDEILINCPWTAPKYNASMLKCLRDIAEAAPKKIIFQLFTSLPAMGSDRLFREREILALLGEEHCRLHHHLPYQDYMTLLEQAHFSIDSYPFGGFNSILDSLHCGKPVITLEGSLARNRISSWVMRALGLDALVADSVEAYSALIMQMVMDPAFRATHGQRVIACDYLSLLNDKNYSRHFVQAFDTLIDDFTSLQQDSNRTPIKIKCS